MPCNRACTIPYIHVYLLMSCCCAGVCAMASPIHVLLRQKLFVVGYDDVDAPTLMTAKVGQRCSSYPSVELSRP